MMESTSIQYKLPPMTEMPHKGKSAQTLSYRKNDRMAGSIPVWSPPQPEKSAPEKALEYAVRHKTLPDTIVPEKALSYADPRANTKTEPSEAFGFGDILDMANPLQHIPLIGGLYREVTGDDIKPVSRIIGGAVFGGAVGAGTALVNVVIEHNTGTDIAGNVMKLAAGKPVSQEQKTHDLPETLLRFTDQGTKTQKTAGKWTSFALNG